MEKALKLQRQLGELDDKTWFDTITDAHIELVVANVLAFAASEACTRKPARDERLFVEHGARYQVADHGDRVFTLVFCHSELHANPIPISHHNKRVYMAAPTAGGPPMIACGEGKQVEQSL